MDNAQGGDPAARVDDWRSQLDPEVRTRIVNKIMETLMKHLPVSVPEGPIELRKIAVRFEEKIYAAATSQSDYLRKLGLKMLSLESRNMKSTQENPQNASSGSASHTGCPGAGDSGYPGAGDSKEELYQMSDYLRKISLKLLSMEGQNEINTQENPQHGQVVQNQSPSYLGETDGEANGNCIPGSPPWKIETNHET